MNKFRALSVLFICIAFVGVYVMGTPEKIIGVVIMGLSLVPGTLFLMKAKRQEKSMEQDDKIKWQKKLEEWK